MCALRNDVNWQKVHLALAILDINTGSVFILTKEALFKFLPQLKININPGAQIFASSVLHPETVKKAVLKTNLKYDKSI